mgnify:CR=1 FL=1
MGVVVSLDGERGKKPRLDPLSALVKDDLKAVNELIIQRMASPVALIPQLAGHIVAAGGKRLRPMLTLAAARMCGYEGRRHIALAACVEFIHTATLLHDDVVDESDLRRGLASANTVWGNKASVLVGDFLFSRSFELMVETGSLEVLGILSKASALIAEGEVMQLITANDTETGETAYLDVIRSKTAQLFAAACSIGAVAADRPNVEKEALETFGMNLGVAFQLIDDVLDYSDSSGEIGKNVGDDLAEGKPTLPLLYAMWNGDKEQSALIREAIENGGLDNIDVIKEAIESTDAIAYTANIAREAVGKAVDALAILPPSQYLDALHSLARFSIERTH